MSSYMSSRDNDKSLTKSEIEQLAILILDDRSKLVSIRWELIES